MSGLVSRWAVDESLVKKAESQDEKVTPTKSMSVSTKSGSNPQPVSRPNSKKSNAKNSRVPPPEPVSRPAPKSEPITPFRTKKNSQRDTPLNDRDNQYHRDTNHRDTNHRDINHRDTNHRDTNHRDTNHRDTNHRDNHSNRNSHSSREGHSGRQRNKQKGMSELSLDAQDFAKRLGLMDISKDKSKSSPPPEKTSKEDLDKLIEEFKLKRDMDWANDDW